MTLWMLWLACGGVDVPDVPAVVVDVDSEPAGLDRAWFRDVDGDGFGDPEVVVYSQVQPLRTVANKLDCDDTDPTIGDGIVFYADADGDGAVDLDDTVTDCTAPEGYAPLGELEDCDDADASVQMLTWYRDRDGDGVPDAERSREQCDVPTGSYMFARDDGLWDCDDNDADTTWATVYADVDGDGSGDATNETLGCVADGWVDNADDCDDRDATLFRTEELCDGEPQNTCDAWSLEDEAGLVTRTSADGVREDITHEVEDGVLDLDDGDTVAFCEGTFAVDLDAAGDVTVVGQGADATVLQGSGGDSVLVAGGDVWVEGITLTGGNATYGGAIHTTGTVELVDAKLTDNQAQAGGAVYAQRLFMLDSQLTYNRAEAQSAALLSTNFTCETTETGASSVLGNTGSDYAIDVAYTFSSDGCDWGEGATENEGYDVRYTYYWSDTVSSGCCSTTYYYSDTYTYDLTGTDGP